MFIVNVVSVHFSATWQFWPFQRPCTRIFWGEQGLMDWATVEGGGCSSSEGKSSEMGWRGFQKCEDTAINQKPVTNQKDMAEHLIIIFQFHWKSLTIPPTRKHYVQYLKMPNNNNFFNKKLISVALSRLVNKSFANGTFYK